MSVRATAQPAVAANDPARGSARLLQRKCACGGGSGEACECDKPKRLQPKLRMTSPGDPLEEQADHVADRVLRFPAARQPHGITPASAAAHDEAAAEVPPDVESTLRSAGRPLDGRTRADFEARFGHDFSRVRIHDDARAAAAVGAQAFTLGSDIVFDAGRYAPGSESGRRLLAHELAHVVQQGFGGPPVLARFPDPGPKPPYKAVVLTREEIAKDPSREKARLNSGQTSAKACREISVEGMKKAGNCPVALDDHAVVTVTKEKVGGLWLQVDAAGIPGTGPLETLHVLGAFLKPRESPAPPALKPTPPPPPPAPPPPSAEEQARMRTAMEEAHSAAGAVRNAQEYAQLRCMVPLGICPHSRPGGLPDEAEIKQYNDECRKKTGYAGPDITPEGGECADLAPLGSEEMIRPGRLAQVREMLVHYASLVRAGVLTDGEMASMDKTIAIAESELGGLRESPSSPAPGPDEAPWVVSGKEGAPAPAPSVLSAGAMAPAAGRLLFSAVARAAPAAAGAAGAPALGAALIGILMVAGLVAIGYLIADYQMRKQASLTLEMLLAELLILLGKLTEEEIERRVRDKTDPKADPKKDPRRPPRPWPPGGNKPAECTVEEVGSGGDPLADLFCEEVTGSSKERDFLVTTPEGDKAWYDALQGLQATECKCGYKSVVEAHDEAARTGRKVPFWAERAMDDLDTQKGRGVRVALRCGLTLRYYVSNKRVADFLNERWSMGKDFVFWTPSDLCD